MSCFGSVGSVRSVRFGTVPYGLVRFGSVRSVRYGSVRFGMCGPRHDHMTKQYKISTCVTLTKKRNMYNENIQVFEKDVADGF